MLPWRWYDELACGDCGRLRIDKRGSEGDGKYVATHSYSYCSCCCCCEAHHDSQAKIYVSCADVIIIMCRQRLRQRLRQRQRLRLRPRRQVKNCYNLMATFQSVARQRDAAVDATTAGSGSCSDSLPQCPSVSESLSLRDCGMCSGLNVVSILCDTKLCFIVVSPNLECDFSVSNYICTY